MDEDHTLRDETSISEISITPDGRIFLFGLSRPLLEMCAELDFRAPDLERRLARLPTDDRREWEPRAAQPIEEPQR